MSFVYPDKYSDGYQADAAAKNGANPYHFNVVSLALPNPHSHLHPLQTKKSNQTEKLCTTKKFKQRLS